MGILSFNVCLFSPESFVNWRDVAKRVMYRLQKAWTDEQIGVCSFIVYACLSNVILMVGSYQNWVRNFGML